MTGNNFEIDWWWFALAILIASLAFVFDWEGKVLRRRLLVGILVLWGAVGLAYTAIVGPALPPPFGEGARVVFRVFAALAAAWTGYLGVDALRTWWRIGDASDDE